MSGEVRGRVGHFSVGISLGLPWEGNQLRGRLGWWLGPTLELRVADGQVDGRESYPPGVLFGRKAGPDRLRVSGRADADVLDLQLEGGPLSGRVQAQLGRATLRGQLEGSDTPHGLTLNSLGDRIQGEFLMPPQKPDRPVNVIPAQLRGAVPLGVAATALACAYACWYEDCKNARAGYGDSDGAESGDGNWDDSDGGGDGGGGGGE